MPNDAFLRLKKDGTFIDDNVTWYWHQLVNGFKIMASRNLNFNIPPTLYHEFHIKDTLITLKHRS